MRAMNTQEDYRKDYHRILLWRQPMGYVYDLRDRPMSSSPAALENLDRAIRELERAAQSLIAQQRDRRLKARESLDQVGKALDQIAARINTSPPPSNSP